MPFTAQASNTVNVTGTASVDIVVSPTSAIVNATNMTPGQSVSGTLNVSNTGTVDEYYFITGRWTPGGTSTNIQATRLASALDVSVTVGATVLYAGPLYNLIDQPPSPGRQLTLATGNENVAFQFILPSTATRDLLNIDLTTDLVFVATS
jgi:hypothetical protein